MEQSRTQRREVQRKLVEASKFMEKLGSKQKELMDLIINEKFKLNMEKYLADYLTIFIDCTVSVLRHQGMEIEFIERFVELYNEFYNDEISKKRLLQGECEMAVKKFEKDLKEKVIECLNEGMKRNDIVEKLVIDFPKASKSMVHRYYDEYKEEIKNVAKDTYTEAIGKLAKDGTDKEVMIGVADIFKNEIEEEKKVIDKGEVEMSSLKVKDINLTIEGKNGDYEINKDGVALYNNSTLIFTNEDSLDNWVSEIKEVFKKVDKLQKI